MTLGVTRGVALDGIDGALVAIEADVSSGLPTFAIGGLPDAACRQSADRVKAAAANVGVSLSQRRVIVNLSPAWLPKIGSAYDLGIAVAALVADGSIRRSLVEHVVHIGELGLDGTVRPVRGVLPLVLAAVRAGSQDVVVPAANAAEAALVRGARVVAADSLARLLTRYRDLADGQPVDDLAVSGVEEAAPSESLRDLGDLAGQAEARRALEVAAAGGHHLFLVGPPGAGKTMLAECLPSILPPLEDEHALQVTAIHSVLGALEGGALVRSPPFVAPHHDASQAALIGGGAQIRPGLISKAHRGVLMLDEASNGKCTSFSKEVTDEDDYEAAWRERATGAGDAGGGLPGVLSDGAGRAGRGHAVDLSVSAAVEVSQGQGGCDRASAP